MKRIINDTYEKINFDTSIDDLLYKLFVINTTHFKLTACCQAYSVIGND